MNEIWKQTEYENYEISNFGNLRNKTTKQIRKWKLNKKGGYYQCVLSLGQRGKSSTVYAHKLVALAFIPNPNNLPQVNHKDGDKLNNNVNNLEWVTNQENQIHARDNLLTKSGEQCRQTRLSLEQVNFARKCLEFTNAELAKRFNCDASNISKIRNGHSWKKEL